MEEPESLHARCYQFFGLRASVVGQARVCWTRRSAVPQWMIIALIVLMGLVVVGFFALMFAEMAAKRKDGKFSASKGARKPGGGYGGRTNKPKPKKSR